ncbi:MAG TPA: zinc-dependent alcohol dehydrogenase family protein [Polyangia bacterium]|jgi:propanol-preferring alcohol dehydrogenase
MRAMVLTRNQPITERPLTLMDLPVPEPGPGEVRVRVRACGLCRTDLHVIEGDLPLVRRPLVPGHQVVGVVDARGPGATRLAPGERVGIAWLRYTDGECVYCRAGQENLCEAARFTGYHADGGFAEYAVVPDAFAYRIPAAFSDEQATPLLCAGIIGYRALERSGVRPGGRLGLYGFGSSAHIVIQIARHRGCEVYVATRGEKHRALARALGAVWVGDAAAAPPVKLDAAILFAPAGELVPVALRALRKGGALALAGIYMTDIPAMSYAEHLFYERDLHSVTANTRRDGEALLETAAAIPLRPEVTVLPLEEANEGLLRLKRDQINGTAVLQV